MTITKLPCFNNIIFYPLAVATAYSTTTSTYTRKILFNSNPTTQCYICIYIYIHVIYIPISYIINSCREPLLNWKAQYS
jgi:hypothetical protein